MRAVLLLFVALFPVAVAAERIELCAEARYLFNAEYTLDVATVVTCAYWTSAAMAVLPARTIWNGDRELSGLDVHPAEDLGETALVSGDIGIVDVDMNVGQQSVQYVAETHAEQ